MNAKEAVANIMDAVVKSLKINLDAGETCPCCGHKKQNRRTISEKMLAANRRNIKKANELRRAKNK